MYFKKNIFLTINYNYFMIYFFQVFHVVHFECPSSEAIEVNEETLQTASSTEGSTDGSK